MASDPIGKKSIIGRLDSESRQMILDTVAQLKKRLLTRETDHRVRP